MGAAGPLSDVPREHDPPDAPDWLDDEARAEWGRVVVALSGMGLVQSDGSTLALYCAAWSHWRAMQDALGHEYTTKGSGDNTVRNPLFVAWKDAAMVVKSYAEQLGLTPKSRLRMPAAPPPPGGRTPMQKFLNDE